MKILRLLCLLLAAMCLFSWACAEEEFKWMDAIGWDSRPDEIREFFGDAAEYVSESAGEFGTMELVRVQARDVYGFHAEYVVCLFYNGTLCMAGCSFTEESVPDGQLLADAFIAEVGAPDKVWDEKSFIEGVLYQGINLCEWEMDAGYKATLSWSEGVREPYTFIMENGPLLDTMMETLYGMDGY